MQYFKILPFYAFNFLFKNVICSSVMNTSHAVILGVIQGLTEFLPISSSGHLVIFQKLLGLKSEKEILFDCSLHIGTLIAVCIYFKKEIKDIVNSVLQFNKEKYEFKIFLNIIIGSIPTAIIGLVFRDLFEKTFASAYWTGIMLCITGILLGITRFFKNNTREIRPIYSLLIGIAQGIAIIPGISRSGATISCALMCGLKKKAAFEFSFLLSIPAIGGAFLLEVVKVKQIINIFPILLGTFLSAIVGLIALKILDKVVTKGDLYYFSPYCITAGIITIIYFK